MDQRLIEGEGTGAPLSALGKGYSIPMMREAVPPRMSALSEAVRKSQYLRYWFKDCL